MADHTDIDATDIDAADTERDADSADSTHGLSNPPPAPAKRGAVGWVLLFGLIIAVSIAISLAIQLDTTESPRVTPPCGGLYSDCCDDWDENWGPCATECDEDSRNRFDDRYDDEERGLFDAEEDFAERRLPPGC